MYGDNLEGRTYARAMASGEPHIILRLQTKESIELGAFVGAFVGLGSEYDRYIKNTNPDLATDAQMFVREVRAGSIEADLIPWLVVAAPFISDMDKALIVEQFIRTWGRRFLSLFGQGDDVATPKTRAELRDWADTVRAVATDPDASATLEAAVFEDKERKIKAAFQFTTPQAREAQQIIEKRQIELERKEHNDHERVLMRFTRSDVGEVRVGKWSGERVNIEEISDRSLSLIYGSELAERQIKHEIREGDENVYKKGFDVDVNVEYRQGKPIAYRVTHVHEVFDLPD